MKRPCSRTACSTAWLLAALAPVGGSAPGGTGTAGGQACAFEEATLTANDGAFGDLFGFSVALDGDTAMVGALYDDDLGDRSGSAYVFTRSGSTWTEQAKLLPSAGASLDYFGTAVDVDGDTALVGASDHDAFGAESGAAFVFQRQGTTWSQEASLTPGDAGPGDFLGYSVALRGDTALIGATGESAAYVFVRAGTTWTQQAKLTATGTNTFGIAVDIHGDTAVVTGQGGTPAEGAFVFIRVGTSWSLQDTLVAADGVPGDSFGSAVAIEGDTVVVGALCDDDLGFCSGSAYVFDRAGTTWTQTQKLLASDGGGVDAFGRSVALSGDALVVGADQADGAVADSGAAYVFTRSGSLWAETGRLVASDGANLDYVGTAVSVDGDEALVGAPADFFLTETGVAYVFSLPQPPTAYCTGKTSSTGCLPFLTASGAPSASAAGAFLVVSNDVVPGRAGVLLYSAAKANLNFHGGKLCVKAPFVRTAVKNPKNPGAGCSGWVLRRDFNDVIQNGSDPRLTAGAVVFAQWRQRDPGDPAGFGDSLSNGLRFEICP